MAGIGKISPVSHTASVALGTLENLKDVGITELQVHDSSKEPMHKPAYLNIHECM